MKRYMDVGQEPDVLHRTVRISPLRAPVRPVAKPASHRVAPISPAHHASVPRAPTTAVPVSSVPLRQRPGRKRFARTVRLFTWPAFMLVAAAIGIAAQSLIIGELAIAIYCLVALVRGISSQVTFGMAGLALGATVLVRMLHGGGVLALTLPVYTWLFFAFGTVQIGIELFRSRR